MKFDLKRGSVLLALLVVAGAILVGVLGTQKSHEARPTPPGQAEKLATAEAQNVYCAVDDRLLPKAEAVPVSFQGGTYYVHSEAEKEQFLKTPENYAFAWDGVCKMKVSKAMDARHGTEAIAVYQDKAYYLCSKEEKEAFLADPERYIKPSAAQ